MFELIVNNAMSTLLAVVVGGVSILAFQMLRAYSKFKYFERTMANIAGPPTTSFLYGNAKLFFDEKTGLPSSTIVYKILPELAKTYPNIIKFDFGHDLFVHLYKPEYIEALLTSSKLIEKGSDYDSLRVWLGNGLLTSKGDKWRFHRKLLTPSFHFQVLNEFIPVINKQSMKLRKKLERFEGDVMAKITSCTLDVIVETAMGVQMNAQDNHDNVYCRNVNRYGELLMQKLMNPIMMIGPIFQFSSLGKEYRVVVEALKEFTRKIVIDRKREMVCKLESNANGVTDKKRAAFLDLMLDHHLRDGDKILSEEEIRDQVDTFTL